MDVIDPVALDAIVARVRDDERDAFVALIDGGLEPWPQPQGVENHIPLQVMQPDGADRGGGAHEGG